MKVGHRAKGKAENTGSKRTGARSGPGVLAAGTKESSLQNAVVTVEL